jgi:hypothetical protein
MVAEARFLHDFPDAFYWPVWPVAGFTEDLYDKEWKDVHLAKQKTSGL